MTRTAVATRFTTRPVVVGNPCDHARIDRRKPRVAASAMALVRWSLSGEPLEVVAIHARYAEWQQPRAQVPRHDHGRRVGASPYAEATVSGITRNPSPFRTSMTASA
jgi:hypothetical protein